MEKGRLWGMIEGLVKTVESHWAGVKWGTQGRNNVCWEWVYTKKC